VFGKEKKENKGIREKEENGWDEYYVRLVFFFCQKIHIIIVIVVVVVVLCYTV